MFNHLGFQSHSDASVTWDRLLFVNPRPFDGFRLNYIHTKSEDFESNCARYNSLSTTKIHLRGSRSLFYKYHDPFFMENLLKYKLSSAKNGKWKTHVCLWISYSESVNRKSPRDPIQNLTMETLISDIFDNGTGTTKISMLV